VKKPILSIILIICILLQVTGCTEVQMFNNEIANPSTEVQIIEDKLIENKSTENETDETSLQQTQTRIRYIAYQDLNESMKTEIKDWENGEVREYKFSTDHFIRSQREYINIKDIDTYRILFEPKNDFIELGPITIYVNKNTETVLGYDLRK